MKLDWISALAEIMPFYGTTDQSWRLMRRINKKTMQIWTNWSATFGIITKNKRVDLGLIGLFKLMKLNSVENAFELTSFEIDWIQLWNIKEYTLFRKIIDACKFRDLIRINKLQLFLSKKDKFTYTYKEIWLGQEYTEEDRNFDVEHNKTVELIKNLNLNIRNIETYIHIEELMNRTIKRIDRIFFIWFKKDNDKRFKDWMDYIKVNNI